MIDISPTPAHHIQRYILNVLRRNEFARFRDLRPPKVDSNVFSYHLNQLLKQKFVEKTDNGYRLALQGLIYSDNMSSFDAKPRHQPNMTMSIILNEHNEALVRYKTVQPMINKVTFICGILQMDDETIQDGALREIQEKVSLELSTIDHIGDCYISLEHEGTIVMNTLMHVFLKRVKKKDVTLVDATFWRHIDDLDDAAPATRNVTRELANMTPGNLFFKEYIANI